MMAPKYMRAVLINTVLEQAIDLFGDPIDEISIGRTSAIVRCGSRSATFGYVLTQSVDERGVPILGSDQYEVRLLTNTARWTLGGFFSALLPRFIKR